MNTMQLECFLAVAESLNFARAAEKLHITQPAVTHQIHTLETELNARLFRRTTRTVELTDAGFSFIHDAKDIVNMSYAARAKLSSQPEDRILPFYIGCTGPFIYSILPNPLRELCSRFPKLHPSVKLLPYQVLQGQLQEEFLHIMFGFLEESLRKKTGTFVQLDKVPAMCVTLPDHPLARKTALVLNDLKSGPMIVCDPHHTSPTLSSVTASILGLRPHSDVYFCDTPSCAEALIKAGLGFAILPDLISIRNPELCYTPVKGLPVLSFGLYYKRMQTHPAIKDFVGIMKQEFTAIHHSQLENHAQNACEITSGNNTGGS